MVLPDSNRVSRVPLYSGTTHGPLGFRLRGYHPLWLTFPGHSSIRTVSVDASAEASGWPYNPTPTTPAGLHRCRLGSLPRSLATTSGISDLISFPEGTEMFQFPSFATPSLCIQPG